MNSTTGLRVILVCLLLVDCFELCAQSQLSFYADVGRNNVSKGLYLNTAILDNYRLGKNSIETGFQVGLKNSAGIIFTGFTINYSRSFRIKSTPVELQGFYLLTPFSDVLRETNFGLLLKNRSDHFDLELGTNFRSYVFKKKAILDYGIDRKASTLHENFNLMYSFSYYIMHSDNNWNAGVTVTNIDYFIINQETNPVFKIQGLFKLKPQVSMFAQAWYQTSGLLNLNINYFGYFIRTGIIWNIR
jgi:hypothetical protein